LDRVASSSVSAYATSIATDREPGSRRSATKVELTNVRNDALLRGSVPIIPHKRYRIRTFNEHLKDGDTVPLRLLTKARSDSL
jgi:hypothetical protein